MREDLTGRKFERLKVIELSDKKYSDGSRLWKCQCRCGKITYQTRGNLIKGTSKSCGCLRNELSSKRNLDDLAEKKFDKLTVLKREQDLIKKNGDKEPRWLCECECGTRIVVLASNLKSKKVRSCGCIKKEIDDLSGRTFEHLYVNKLIKNENGRTFYECQCDCKKKIIVNRDSLISGATTSCGHIRSDRALKNLEFLKQYYVSDTNLFAAKGKQILKSNTSGVTGVCKYKNKWRAYITFQKKRYYLGEYEKLEDATMIRKKAESKLHDDFLKWFAKEFPERWEKINKK